MDSRQTDFDEIYLELTLHKSLQRDEDGNVIFTVEASNENLDLEQQRVLQDALLGSKGHFLKSGVISKDHMYRKMNTNGSFTIDESYVIGEPLEVFTKGTSTFVKGKLYAGRKHADEFIDLLDKKSTRVRASVGGLMPRVKQVIENGRKIGKVGSVLWDDLALTIAPVNPTLGYATSMAKSLSSKEFVKTLSAGYGTDSAAFTNGRALQKEDVEHKTLLQVHEKAIASLVGAIADGDVNGLDDAETFLIDHGITGTDAHDIARAICKKSNSFMEVFPMEKESLWDKMKNGGLFAKSVGSKEDDDDPYDDDEDEDGDDDEDEGAAAVVKSLTESVDTFNQNLGILSKAIAALAKDIEQQGTLQKAMCEGLIGMEGMLKAPQPRKGVVTQPEQATMAKALAAMGATGESASAPGVGRKPFTPETFITGRNILLKARADGEIDLHTSIMYEAEMNKSIGQASYPFSNGFLAFMKNHTKA